MILQIPEPNPRQKEFLLARERFTAYGGARGGGKSWVIRVKAALMALTYKGIKILIIRRTFPELRDNHIMPLRLMLAGIATYKDTDKTITFPTGSTIRFGYLDSEADIDQYQGQEYDVIFIDEATHFTELQFRILTACLRGVNDFPKRMYLSCNPGNVGHAWVKRLFIDREYLPGENPDDYRFIPARVSDNTALLASDSGYVEMLESLPPDLKRAWLEGDWDALAGQYFSEFRRGVHVIEPTEIPTHWRRYFAMDYGLDMLAGYWAAFDERGRCFIYREVYRSDVIVSDAARIIRELGKGETIDAFLAPSDLWGRSADTGKSQAERYLEEGLRLTQVVAKSRVDGWMDVHEWLKGDSLRIFSTCPNLIRCLPLLQHDPRHPNDCATEPHEITHAPDALRYLLAGRPAPADKPIKPKVQLPWALQDDKPKGGYCLW